MISRYRYTHDELNALMFSEQGYLVVATLDRYTLGQIVPPHPEIQTPMRVTGPSNWEEYRAQCLRACLLDTGEPFTGLIDRFPNYYRTEAAD